MTPAETLKADPRAAQTKRRTKSGRWCKTSLRLTLKDFRKTLKLLEPKDRLAFLERMLKHILPPPLNELEKLSDEQLDEVINRLKTQD
jgi:hypothetical protein